MLLSSLATTQIRPVPCTSRLASAERWLSARLPAASRLALGILALGLPLPYLLGLADASYLAVLAAWVPLAIILAALHGPQDRRTVLQIGAIGLAVRVVFHLIVFAWATAGGGPFLGPDSSVYFEESRLLAARGFAAEPNPVAFFGSYDCAHYYLFAAARRFFEADLYGLQTLNVALTAFTGPLFYSAWRQLGLQHPLLLGVAVAVYPSWVALSANDLLKDPSIVAATTLGLWGLVRMAGARGTTERIVLVALVVPSLMYVRMARFYVVAFLELALAGALVLTWVLGRRPRGRLRPGTGLIVLTIALVEVLPGFAGWPATPRLFAGAVTHTVATPLMRHYASGLLDRAAAPAASMESERPRPMVREQAARTDRSGERLPALTAATLPARAADASPAPEIPTVAGRLARLAVNGVRKLLGPFPWIPPATWTPREILLNDFSLFPGMPVWYAIFPVGLLGLGTVAWRWWTGEARSFPLVALALFSALLLAQYLALNLSYRQREFMVPFLACAALLALQFGPPIRRWWRLYALYWVLLGLMAAGHLAVRAAVA
jgi:hypothetical protein